MNINEKILIYALKYALDMGTSAVEDVIEKITKTDLTNEMKSIIISEIEYFIKLADCGELIVLYKIDEWKQLLNTLKEIK